MTYTLELTEQEHQALVAILAEAPWRIANPIMFKLAQQARDQMGGLAAAASAGIPPVNDANRRPDGGTRWMPPAREER